MDARVDDSSVRDPDYRVFTLDMDHSPHAPPFLPANVLGANDPLPQKVIGHLQTPLVPILKEGCVWVMTIRVGGNDT